MKTSHGNAASVTFNKFLKTKQTNIQDIAYAFLLGQLERNAATAARTHCEKQKAKTTRDQATA